MRGARGLDHNLSRELAEPVGPAVDRRTPQFAAERVDPALRVGDCQAAPAREVIDRGRAVTREIAPDQFRQRLVPGQRLRLRRTLAEQGVGLLLPPDLSAA